MINYLKLNTREKEIVNNATSWTIWSKNKKLEFKNSIEVLEYANTRIKSDEGKFLIYAIMNDTDALIGTIN